MDSTVEECTIDEAAQEAMDIIASFQAHIEQLQTDNVHLMTKNLDLNVKNKDQENYITHLEHKYTEQSARLQELESVAVQTNKLSAVTARLKMEHENLKSDHKELQALNPKRLMKRNKDLQKQNQTLQTEKQILKRKNSDYIKEAQNLEDRLITSDQFNIAAFDDDHFLLNWRYQLGENPAPCVKGSAENSALGMLYVNAKVNKGMILTLDESNQVTQPNNPPFKAKDDVLDLARQWLSMVKRRNWKVRKSDLLAIQRGEA